MPDLPSLSLPPPPPQTHPSAPQPKAGFGAHPHRDAEIFSYIVQGELSHKVGRQGWGEVRADLPALWRSLLLLNWPTPPAQPQPTL